MRLLSWWWTCRGALHHFLRYDWQPQLDDLQTAQPGAVGLEGLERRADTEPSEKPSMNCPTLSFVWLCKVS
uniref:Uncharacterized protein n=1 Tax=Gasterosteus aculeatus TaxID=69293 RepID=G3N998_GASAC